MQNKSVKLTRRTFSRRAAAMPYIVPATVFGRDGKVPSREHENLKSGKDQLMVDVPTSQEGRLRTVGIIPFEILSEDRDKAGVIIVKRPENQKPTKPAVPVKIQEKKNQKEPSKFKTTLANGVTVELVGICEYPSTANNGGGRMGADAALPGLVRWYR